MLLMAVVTNILFSQMMGEECASPGIGVFHLMFVPFPVFQMSGRSCPSATPDADSPEKTASFPNREEVCRILIVAYQ